jgi:hypothetical protein
MLQQIHKTITNNQEIYQSIETLKPGDLIKVYPNTYKPIKYIGYNILLNTPSDTKTMYIMKKTETNNLIEDLIVTGEHFIEDNNNNKRITKLNLEDKILIPAKNSNLFTKINDNEIYTYYHLVLDTENDQHCLIWANGILSESTKKSHFMSYNFKMIE